jgi:hypothetical protein
MPRFHLTLLAMLAASACSALAPHQNRADLLKALRQCLNEVPKRGAASFESPCVHKDVSSLNGITRAELISALGPAQFCTAPAYGGFPTALDCPPDENPQWSFYALPENIILGGGPELVCEADGHPYCVRLLWRRSI